MIEPTYRDNFSGIAYPCRGLFLVDPDKILKMMCFHPWSLGRSTDEILRSIDSVQLTRKYENKVCTPADWTVKVDIFEKAVFLTYFSITIASAYGAVAETQTLFCRPWTLNAQKRFQPNMHHMF